MPCISLGYVLLCSSS